jgi:hypothetical protein
MGRKIFNNIDDSVEDSQARNHCGVDFGLSAKINPTR